MRTSASTLSTSTPISSVMTRMSFGVLFTLIIAALTQTLGLVPLLFGGVWGYGLMFAPLLISLYLGWNSAKMTESSIKRWFFIFAGVMGLSLSVIFQVYTGASIALALVGTAVSFGALASWGYVTKRDISGLGPFLFAALIGIIVASIVNLFVVSSQFQLILNILTIVVFLGLTAYDVNRIKQIVDYSPETEKTLWFAALSLYINFINIFTSLLQLTGTRSE